ncbi:hypothetical protein HPB52_024979 [Rhipicephalus sanguineus]|uniref:Tick transposon n=1 Tax=Rhipicephalus sanguineus TaxID=34632 RepID=A0A9D4P8W0_RHISA|nr:hypothetical protein HPB52_024979 [Rhipicephalus sanguineus]
MGMSIDTTGAQSVGSDHNSIWIELSSSYRPRPGVERKERHHALPEWAIDKLVETLENSVEQVDTDEYDVFEQWVVDNINSVTKTSNPATKTQKHRPQSMVGQRGLGGSVQAQASVPRTPSSTEAWEAQAIGLHFNPAKSACMVMASQEDPMQYTESRLMLQGNPIEWTSTYRYLGVTLSAAPHYTHHYESELKPRAMRKRAFLNSRALWAFNKFEVTRELWKSVAVPALTFANSVLCLSSGTRQSLEVRQREAGRAALGVHRGVPNEAVQGEVGWSSFEAREAVSKLAYERRLSQLPDGRWAREVFKYIHLKCINTKWVLRTKRLAERYEVAPCRLTEKPQRDRRTKVREAVQEAESASWRTMAAGKPALSFYSKAKQAIEKEPLYENSKGSGLLCEARCGMLRTRLLRATYTPNLDTTCPLCTLEEEKHRAHRATLPSIETTGLRHFICGRYATGTTAEIAGNGAGFPGVTRATAVGNGGGNEASIRNTGGVRTICRIEQVVCRESQDVRSLAQGTLPNCTLLIVPPIVVHNALPYTMELHLKVKFAHQAREASLQAAQAQGMHMKHLVTMLPAMTSRLVLSVDLKLRFHALVMKP